MSSNFSKQNKIIFSTARIFSDNILTFFIRRAEIFDVIKSMLFILKELLSVNLVILSFILVIYISITDFWLHFKHQQTHKLVLFYNSYALIDEFFHTIDNKLI